jgi:hypothetical protein
MSKKQKRSVSGQSTTAAAPAVASTSTSGAAAAPRRFSSVSTEFNPDYTYVKAGLRRIATLATIFIAIMIVLTFILK